MSKLWTKQEEAVLSDYMGTRRVLYWRDKLAIHKLIPNRSPAAIEKRWGIMLKRWNKVGNPPIGVASRAYFDAQKEINRGMAQLALDGLPKIPPPQYNPVDVAFTRPITKTDIIRHYRDMGLRGKVNVVYDLGD